MTVAVNPVVAGMSLDAGITGTIASLGAGVTTTSWARSGSGPVVALTATRMILAGGQSLAIGTRNSALSVPAPPAQPELSSNFKAFNGVGSTGKSLTTIIDADTSSFVQYQELTGSSGASGYYTHGTGFFKYISTAAAANQQWLWAPAGVGGTSIINLDLGGTTPSYANSLKMLQRAAVIDPNTVVTAILFDQGEQDWSMVTPATYTARLVTYKANLLSAVASVFPSSNPKFVITQCGDGWTTLRVHIAQADAARSGLAVVAGPKYWLNRNFPNVAGAEQLHLNVNGYPLQGEMEARATVSEIGGTPFKPTIVNSVVYTSSNTVTLKCSTPNGGALVFDTTTLPACPGYGINIEKPDLTQITPTSVTISGTDIICQFAETIYPDFRVKIGYTLADITQDGTSSGNYIPCTNIRGSIGNASRSGGSTWYDWLMLDRYTMGKTEVGYVKPSTLGTELWRTVKVGLTDGLLTAVTFDGTNMVVTRNGVTNAATPTVSFVDGGTNVDGLYWAIKTGRTYRVDVTSCQVTSGAGAHEIRIYVGNTIIKRSSTNSGVLGPFTQDVTAIADGILTLQLNNVAVVGSISGISVKEVL